MAGRRAAHVRGVADCRRPHGSRGGALLPYRRRAGTLKIRLWGTEADCAAALEQLRGTFAVQCVSRPRRDRPPSKLVRVYVEVSAGEDPSEGTLAR